MLDRPRSSRIFYGGKFFAYPLKPFEALIKLGIFNSILCVLSWLKARLFPVRDPSNFEDWVSNQFGKRLFNTFFKSYTEKVWGMSCREISADWAAQRIKGLSLGSAIKNALFPQRTTERQHQGDQDADQFLQVIRAAARNDVGSVRGKNKAMGGQIEMGCKVVGCAYDELDGHMDACNIKDQSGDETYARSRARHFLRADARTDARHFASRFPSARKRGRRTV